MLTVGFEKMNELINEQDEKKSSLHKNVGALVYCLRV